MRSIHRFFPTFFCNLNLPRFYIAVFLRLTVRNNFLSFHIYPTCSIQLYVLLVMDWCLKCNAVCFVDDVKLSQIITWQRCCSISPTNQYHTSPEEKQISDEKPTKTEHTANKKGGIRGSKPPDGIFRNDLVTSGKVLNEYKKWGADEATRFQLWAWKWPWYSTWISSAGRTIAALSASTASMISR